MTFAVMKEPYEAHRSSDTSSESSSVLTLAVAVGMIVFFATDAVEGGLSGVQGFLMGVFGVLLFFLFAVILDRYRARKPTSETFETDRDVTVSRSDTGDDITIQIHVGPGSKTSMKPKSPIEVS